MATKNLIKRYIVVSSMDLNDFLEQINDSITNGYQPQGGVSTVVSPHHNALVFTQALFKI